VERFLEREGAGIDGYLTELEGRTPFRQTTPSSVPGLPVSPTSTPVPNT
jgi:hypothetical protein